MSIRNTGSHLEKFGLSMAKNCAVIAVTAERWRFQLAVLSALINYRNVSTMEQYSSQKANILDFPLASDLTLSCPRASPLTSKIVWC